MDEDRLDVLLRQRADPAVPEGLSARIIAAAAERSRKGAVWEDMIAVFMLPRPAYALSVVLFLGFMLGVYVDIPALSAGLSVEALSDFMAVEDEFTAYEFLETEWL